MANLPSGRLQSRGMSSYSAIHGMPITRTPITSSILFFTLKARNYFRYHNPAVDKLLDDARIETDDLRRVKLYREAEQLILQDAPAVMLLHYTYESVFQPYVEGVVVSALGDLYVPFARSG